MNFSGLKKIIKGISIVRQLLEKHFNFKLDLYSNSNLKFL